MPTLQKSLDYIREAELEKNRIRGLKGFEKDDEP